MALSKFTNDLYGNGGISYWRASVAKFMFGFDSNKGELDVAGYIDHEARNSEKQALPTDIITAKTLDEQDMIIFNKTIGELGLTPNATVLDVVKSALYNFYKASKMINDNPGMFDENGNPLGKMVESNWFVDAADD